MAQINKLLAPVLVLYSVTVGIAALYYNWQHANTNGLVRWVMLGEVVATGKALVWPYFAFHTQKATLAATSEIERTQLSKQQISESELNKFIIAINYSQQATYLLNSAPHERLENYPNLQDILAYRRKALEVGKAADTNVLNNVFPDLGDRFKNEFLEAVSLFVQGCETQSDEKLSHSKALNDEWADWYMAHRRCIEDAINGAVAAK